MKLLVIGTGYVGLVSGTCFAEMGHHVTCLDIDNRKIAELQNGIIPIYEPGLKEMVNRHTQAGRLTFTIDYTVVSEATVCFIAVDTPASDDGSASLTYVKQVAKSIAEHMTQHTIIVNKSTVPVGSAEIVRGIIDSTLKARGVDISFDVVSNPEFLKEGDAVNDFMKPDRVVIGADSKSAAKVLRDIYSSFMLNHDRLIIVDVASAEMIKYAANAMLATRIAFMNELSGLCEVVGADITEVRRGIGSDQRIGHSFLYAGAGYGGSCFPKDIRALQSTARERGHPLSIIESVHTANERQKEVIGKKLLDYFSNDLEGRTIAILGLAFKPNTDDMREAPSLTVIRQLLQHGATLRLYDPVAMDKARVLIGDQPAITWCTNEVEAVSSTDAVVLVTEWRQFRYLDWKQLFTTMQAPILFDGRNQYSPDELRRLGADYISIGRHPVLSHSRSNTEGHILERELPQGLKETLKDRNIAG
ncbi:UDP-glucose 6-dehydrogenase [Chlamydiales bacterium SCGC AG-110-P3]|nr:UDP-glucose 6-dehydrogenase [Chlamydiales bacterium SCGC AG-110-P3]